MFHLQGWLSSTPFPLGTRQRGRWVCRPFFNHIVIALCHSPWKLLKVGTLPAFIVNVLLNHLGKPILDFHMCIYKLQFKARCLLCHRTAKLYKEHWQKLWPQSKWLTQQLHAFEPLRMKKGPKHRITPRKGSRVQWHKKGNRPQGGSRLYYLPAVWTWVSSLALLSLSFLIYKREVIATL